MDGHHGPLFGIADDNPVAWMDGHHFTYPVEFWQKGRHVFFTKREFDRYNYTDEGL